mgnify:CR=1 FL=1
MSTLTLSITSFSLALSESREIVVDGFSDDWEDVSPIFVDAEGDMKIATDVGSDIKAIYSVKDDKSLYIMIEFWGKANHSNYLDLYFNDKSEGPAYHFMFNLKGFVSWSKLWEEKGVRVGYEEVAEIVFHLKLFEDIPAIYINPLVYIPSINKWDDSAERWVMIWIDKQKGIILDYFITIDDPSTHLVRAKLNMKNLKYFPERNFQFRLRSHLFYPLSYYLVNVSFSSKTLTLDYQEVEEGLWKVSVPEEVNELYVTYVLNNSIVPANGNYLDDHFGVFNSGLLFIYPEAPIALSLIHI